MPTVTFVQHNKTVTVQDGETILDAALDNDIPLEHNCGGNCACATCHVIVQEGFEQLPEMTEDEEDQLDEAEGPTLTSRLGCQCALHGEQHVTVEIPHTLVTGGRVNQT
jgi:ferredoxin, 2Fe-2S